MRQISKRVKRKIYEQISCLADKETTNATIIDIYGKADISAIPAHIEKENLYLAYQGEVNGYYATSFEEAFILTNYDNAITNELLKELKPNIYKGIIGEESEYEKNKENSYKWQMKLENAKESLPVNCFTKLLTRNQRKEFQDCQSIYLTGSVG